MAIFNTIYFLQLTELNYVLPTYDWETVKKDAETKDVFLIRYVVGNAQANHITGDAGNNGILDGGAGADTLDGGNGDDWYRVDNAGDVIVEHVNNGWDWVYASVSYTLSANVDNLILTGSGHEGYNSYGNISGTGSYENINGTGNALDNRISGTLGNNHLYGLGGDDTLFDVGGADTLEGGTGDDIYSVSSRDSSIIETANGGRDTVGIHFEVSDLAAFDFSKYQNVEIFHFTKFASGKYAILEDGNFFVVDDKLNAKKPTDLDDFQVKEDTIGLSKSIFSKIAKKGDLKKAAFWTGSKAHDKDDRIIYDKKAGDLYYDADGSGSRKAVKFADVDKNLKMTASDFLVF